MVDQSHMPMINQGNSNHDEPHTSNYDSNQDAYTSNQGLLARKSQLKQSQSQADDLKLKILKGEVHQLVQSNSQSGLTAPAIATTTKDDTSNTGSSEVDLKGRENRWNSQLIGGSAEHGRRRGPHRADQMADLKERQHATEIKNTLNTQSSGRLSSRQNLARIQPFHTSEDQENPLD